MPRGASPEDPRATLSRFIAALRAGCAPAVPASALTAPPAEEARAPALLLAEAALHYAAAPAGPPHPAQLVVLGPTQTGKSTLVNLLVGQAAAQVSPLAGFTVHPQGFWLGAGDEAWTRDLFPGWPRNAPADLTPDDLTGYALTTLQDAAWPTATGTASPPTNAPATLFDVGTRPTGFVVWDTPDFDSLAARSYARGVLETAAFADAYVLVLSKEKYSDLSVWHLLALLAPLRRPLAIVLNKLTPDAEQTIVASLRTRLAERGGSWGDVPIIPLPYDPALAEADAVTSGAPVVPSPDIQPAITQLRTWLQPHLTRTPQSATRRRAGVRALLKTHWDDWLAPVEAEQTAAAEWQRMVAQTAERFMEAYRRDYLEHPQRYDSFRRAALELLVLLELPRVGGLIARARQVLTWPARQLLSAGRSAWAQYRPPGRAVHSLGAEATVLVDTLDALLMGLERDVVRRCRPAGAETAFWSALEARLSARRDALRQSFEAAIQSHHAEMTRAVRDVANRLYAELQRQPARLAALRAGRLTIDLGTILLAVKTGGLSPLDAVWAPAAFALSSLLLEGATGLEMRHLDRGLRTRQAAAVERTLVQGTFVREWRALVEDLTGPGLYGISAAQVAAARAALDAWERADD